MIKFINELPNDIKDIIIDFLDIYKINVIKFRYLLYYNYINDFYIQNIASNRIKLFYIIHKKYKILKKYIINNFKDVIKNFYLPNSNCNDNFENFTSIIRNISKNNINNSNKNKCIYYCSFIKNGTCKFLLKKEEHYFKNLIITLLSYLSKFIFNRK